MLRPELPLPKGASEEDVLLFLRSIPISLPPWTAEVIAGYCQYHLHRFLYTYGLVKGLKGRCLELGSAPYFMTLLLRQFTELDLVLANYFGADHKSDKSECSTISYNDFYSGKNISMDLCYHHFNIEAGRFPFQDAQFDVVLFCEIIEHLFIDPLAVIKEIKRVLKPGGALILTTPNANRLENMAKMIAGTNIYDPYSGYYGQYGRHNREYNISEILQLLDYCGFIAEEAFAADAIENRSKDYVGQEQMEHLLSNGRHDLGQFIFLKARNSRECGKKRPSFLYMNFPPLELEEVNVEVLRGNDIIRERNVFLIGSWYGCEDWNGTPTRWMGNEAQILVSSETSRAMVMGLNAVSFHRPRNMEIFAEGVSLQKILLSSHPAKIQVKVPMKKGINHIMFKAIDGGERPCDIAKLSSNDARSLSFALQNVEFRY